MRYRIVRSSIFHRWFAHQTEKEKFQILKRLSLIEQEGHFGDHKDIGKGLYELKWINGRRVYYAIQEGQEIIILLCGGNKNGQNKDINEARKILQKYIEGQKKQLL